jgi:hypothetical protein
LRKVATLFPLYPLEGGLDVYPEFAKGQFAYRTGDRVDAAARRAFRSTSPSLVSGLFAKDPPAAFLLGFEPELEAPFRAFVAANGYCEDPAFKLQSRYGDAKLYVRAN